VSKRAQLSKPESPNTPIENVQNGATVSPLNNFQFDVLDETTPVLVDFYADWCAPCRALSPRLESLSRELATKLKIVKVNIEDHPEVAAKYGIRSLPTLIRFEKGEPVRTFVGNPVGDALMNLAY